MLLSPPGRHPVPIPSENPNKLAPFGTLNPGANFRTEATLSTRQKSLRPPQSDSPFMPPLWASLLLLQHLQAATSWPKRGKSLGLWEWTADTQAVSCSSKRTWEHPGPQSAERTPHTKALVGSIYPKSPHPAVAPTEARFYFPSCCNSLSTFPFMLSPVCV